ncbi:hypothetical protein NKH84_09335 [Mesorhizobium sp. M0902]|uniref:hypothetical protein n=1 Tax=Mesorhizobium sp. M0902 TaxID=2957021 RepID=UPI00333882F1
MLLWCIGPDIDIAQRRQKWAARTAHTDQRAGFRIADTKLIEIGGKAARHNHDVGLELAARKPSCMPFIGTHPDESAQSARIDHSQILVDR